MGGQVDRYWPKRLWMYNSPPAILCQQFQKEHCEFVSALSKSPCEVCNLGHLCILGFLAESLKLDLATIS